MPESPLTPQPQELQFERAELLPAESPEAESGQRCASCKQAIRDSYYHAQGQVVCPGCAERIQSGQQAPPPLSLARSAAYGFGAALAGCILYATVSIVTGLQIGLMAIVVGIMVGKAIRYASNGLGGRPQQILAVGLTHFAITTSFLPVAVYQMAKNPRRVTKSQPAQSPQTQTNGGVTVTQPPTRPSKSFGSVLLLLIVICAAAPFLDLGSGISGLLTLFIIFIGLQRAWKLTGRSDILVMGPYEAPPVP